MAANQRRYERFGGTLTVQVLRDGANWFGTIYEISLGGAFLELSPMPPVGALLTVVVTLSPTQRVRLGAEVRYYAPERRGPRGTEGVGIMWHELDDAKREVVEALVERASSGKPLRDASE